MKIKSIVLLLFTAAIWGFAFVAQTTAAGSMPPFAFNGIRFLLGAASLIPVILIFERQKMNLALIKKTLIISCTAGVLLFAASSFQQVGLYITGDPSEAAFITTLYNVLVPIIGFLFLKRRTGKVTWLGVLISVIGFYFLSFFGSAESSSDTASEFYINLLTDIGLGDYIHLIGVTALFLGAIFWALHITLIARFAEEIPSLKFACLQFVVVGILSMLLSVIVFESYTIRNICDAGISILYCGLGSVGVAYTCQILGQKGADPTGAAIICSTESVFSAIGSAVILKQYLTGSGYLGCFLIFIGMLLAQIDGTDFLCRIQAKFRIGDKQ